MKRMVGIVLLVTVLMTVFMTLLLKPAAEVRGKSAAMPIAAQMTPEQQLAQDLALADSRVRAFTNGHRSEVFGVRGVIAGQYTEAASECAVADCRQVEIYNWDENVAFSILVNIETQQVLDVLRQPGHHPGINKRLHELSIEIATNAPEVIEALGYKPTGDMALAAVDADLLGSSCTGEHVCVGPTFRTDDSRILWAIVDLTEEKLAGIYWTEAAPDGEFEPFVPTGCPAPGNVNRDGWTMDYAATAWDSLNVYNVAYNGVAVATGIKLVEWHADYGSSGYRDSTGCSSGGGGFTIYPYGETQVLDLLDDQNNVIGFEVVQDFRMSNWGASCNYRYEQRIGFYADGSFRPVSAAYGKGCGTNAIYRPVVRLNLAVADDANDRFSRWDGSAWQVMTTEDYLVPYTQAGHGPHHIDANGYSWKIEDTITGQGYYIVQDVGQFENGEGDNPFLYPTLHHANEGDTDLPVIASNCCYDDHRQGPDNYLNGENINGQNIVLWYVPQAVTDATAPDYYCWTVTGEPTPETYPCFMGPLFVPMSAAPTAGFTHNGPLLLGNTAVFTNTTTGPNPITYTWDFGDGSPLSNVENPTHDYVSVGDYTVTLTATNAFGVEAVTEEVRVGVAPTAVFTHPITATTQSMIPFTNLSIGTPELTYAWDFGDGSPIVTVENPFHVFINPGPYTVTLEVSNPFGTDSTASSIVINEAPIAPTAAFTATTAVLVNQTVNFINMTIGTPPISYTWDFGDGSPLSDLENPTHSYTAVGDYTVTLTATNDVGSNVYTDVIRVGVVPTAVFTHPPTAHAQSPVPFTNQSQGTPELSYTWDFGDGSPVSTVENPTHVYASAGMYTVTLVVNSPFGSDEASSGIMIDEAPVAPTAAFTATLTAVVNQPITFTNQTVGTAPITYTWDFGDDSPLSGLENPTHIYVIEGDYTVTLTATNNIGLSVYTGVVRVGVAPTAVFTHPTTAIVQSSVQFTNQSQGTPELSYVWDFGDGSPTSTTQNPQHVYTAVGTYTVTLTVNSPFGSDVSTSRIVIEAASGANYLIYIPIMRREE